MAKTAWTPARIVAVVLGSVGLAFLVYVLFVAAVVFFSGSEEREARAAIRASVAYDCPDKDRLGVLLTNNSDKRVERTEYRLVVKQRGHSTNLVTDYSRETDSIIEAHRSVHGCTVVRPEWKDPGMFTAEIEILNAKFSDD